jgi:predicted transport protein
VKGRDTVGDSDVETSLKAPDELRYIMGLIRQSYER